MLQGKWTFLPITNSVHDTVAPNSTYTKSVHNECVMFSGSHKISNHKDVLTVTNTRKPLQTEYKLHGHTLSRVTFAKYLGVTNELEMGHVHINNICDKANRTLSFLRRNRNIGSTAMMQQAYVTLVRPLVEYAKSV